jgi:ABC-type transport system involved in cytochrome bd biosynthesis fused ATPase/permease subunit
VPLFLLRLAVLAGLFLAALAGWLTREAALATVGVAVAVLAITHRVARTLLLRRPAPRAMRR